MAVLSRLETELIVVASTMCQGLSRSTSSHLKGLERSGLSAEDVGQVKTCVEFVARWCSENSKSRLEITEGF